MRNRRWNSHRLHLSTFDWQKMFVCSTIVLVKWRDQSMFSLSVVPPTRIKRNSTIFDGDWRRVWCLMENLTATTLLGTILQAKHRSFDASTFNDNPMTKSLTEKSIEKSNVSSPKETKQNTCFLPSNIFIRKEKQIERSFHFNWPKPMKNWWKRGQSIVEIRCSNKSTNQRRKSNWKQQKRKQIFERENLQN